MASREQETCVQTPADDRRAAIRRLNDGLRQGTVEGRVAITQGVIELGYRALPQIMAAIATYDQFDEGNDPHREHDFGSLTHVGTSIFWKIDYYDRAMAFGSPDPADPTVTTRVLTIMLAREY